MSSTTKINRNRTRGITCSGNIKETRGVEDVGSLGTWPVIVNTRREWQKEKQKKGCMRISGRH